ncbi:hypothetical protein ACFS32_07185 [Novosphingobium pokkalii]|uniref:hypothetical protein n=1 Tax=Novosphingobium pokkalii TaxID=1770194 RepID=UPI00363EB2F4
MKKLILAALIPATVGLAAPALAQPAPPPPGGWHHGPGPGAGGWMTPRRDAAIRQDIGQLRFAIDRAQRNRTISPREAARCAARPRWCSASTACIRATASAATKCAGWPAA